MAKTVEIRFEAMACFSVTLEVEDDQYEELQKLCEKENPGLLHGNPLHKLLVVDNVIQAQDFDYLDPTVDIEKIELI